MNDTTQYGFYRTQSNESYKPFKSNDNNNGQEVEDLVRMFYGKGYGDKVENKGMNGFLDLLKEKL